MTTQSADPAPDVIEQAKTRITAMQLIYRAADPGDWIDFVTDVLADLRHFCAANGIDFDERDERAEELFQTERPVQSRKEG